METKEKDKNRDLDHLHQALHGQPETIYPKTKQKQKQ